MTPAHGAGLVAATIDASGENLRLSAEGPPGSLVAIACAVLEKAWHILTSAPDVTEADRARGLAINRAMEALVNHGNTGAIIPTERTGTEREALLFLLRYALQLTGGPAMKGNPATLERLIREIEAEAGKA